MLYFVYIWFFTNSNKKINPLATKIIQAHKEKQKNNKKTIYWSFKTKTINQQNNKPMYKYPYANNIKQIKTLRFSCLCANVCVNMSLCISIKIINKTTKNKSKTLSIKPTTKNKTLIKPT